ncbi:hypothetical protein E4U43_000291 [Claviceps pusilla]|uniref:Fungal calcium binding protein domain-containing protein n=1 Tax=Claviceps pusilla TaxID=123648 RepID=A0A9P7SZ74_9HYPO|nr:hypothetical protein E4U43_000291 [Claviceps pusilla]
MRFFQILAVAFATVALASPEAESIAEENVAVIKLPHGCNIKTIAKCILSIGKKTGPCRDAIKSHGLNPVKDLNCLHSVKDFTHGLDDCKKCVPHKFEVLEA